MTAALVVPPACDPTAPYVSVPLLAGWLRSRGLNVLTVDANLGAWEHLLGAACLGSARDRVLRRFRELDGRASLCHEERGRYLSLLDSLRESADLPAAVAPALDCLRGRRPGFYEPEGYGRAVDALDRALRLLGAAHDGLELGFASYRSPFSLLTREEREADAGADRNPFHGYFRSVLIPELLDRGVSVVGLSVVFPAQLQPAYSLAYQLRAEPSARGVHLTVGGPAMSQILGRLAGEARERAMEPFDTAVVNEGEEALLELLRAIQGGSRPRGLITGRRLADLSCLPAPDFDGLPLDRYLSPEPVLPYDFSRGCAWGRCAFCHYGLAQAGTAPYRERPVPRALEHLRLLGSRHGARLFYLSEDSVRPEGLLELARGLSSGSGGTAGPGGPIRWSTDVRPERLLGSPDACRALREGGALSFSFGVESGSARLLRLIRKGIAPQTMRAAIRATAAAGIAAEAMVFTDFPTETAAEARETLTLLEELGESISLFMCGTFGLTSGSAVARDPERFGIREVWTVRGDELELGLQHTPRRHWKSERERAAIDRSIAALSRRWRFARYPWAGSLSTAHTMLWYDRLGPDVFRRFAGRPPPPASSAPSGTERTRFDVPRMRARFEREEGELWGAMVGEERAVSRERYRELASRLGPEPCRRPSGASSSGGSASRAGAPRRAGGSRGSRPRARRRPRAGEGP